MSEEYRTKAGRVLTDEELDGLAEEAERGYDVDALLQRDLADAIILERAAKVIARHERNVRELTRTYRHAREAVEALAERLRRGAEGE
jgi:hypothetical protein